MPELAEVEHSRRQWDPGLGQLISEVLIARPKSASSATRTPILRQRLPGQRLLDSQARGKQMLFHFCGDLWLGVHLGMSGELRREDGPDYNAAQTRSPHPTPRPAARSFSRINATSDACACIRAPNRPLVELPRSQRPVQGSSLSKPPSKFLQRRRRTPLKAVLLMQEHFPGIGNWMADEILWRARLHPPRSPVRSTRPRPAALGTGPLGQPHRRPHHQRRLDLSARPGFSPTVGKPAANAPAATRRSTARPSAAGPPAGARNASPKPWRQNRLRLEIPLSERHDPDHHETSRPRLADRPGPPSDPRHGIWLDEHRSATSPCAPVRKYGFRSRSTGRCGR